MRRKKSGPDLRKNGKSLLPLSDQERRFVQEYRKDYNIARAVTAAGLGKNNASRTGFRMLSDPKIQGAILALERQTLEKLELSVEEIKIQLFYLATRDASDFVYPKGHPQAGEVRTVNDMDARARAVINGLDQEVSVITLDDGREIRKLKTKLRITPKEVGIDLAMKHKGMFAPVQGEVKVSFDWDKIIRDAQEKMRNDPVEKRIREPLLLPDPRKKRTKDANLADMNDGYTVQELVGDESSGGD